MEWEVEKVSKRGEDSILGQISYPHPHSFIPHPLHYRRCIRRLDPVFIPGIPGRGLGPYVTSNMTYTNSADQSGGSNKMEFEELKIEVPMGDDESDDEKWQSIAVCMQC